MKAVKQFLITGVIRLLRSKSECLLLVLWPFLIVGFMRAGAVPWQTFPLALLAAAGMQIAVTVGYDYGRARETGALHRLLVTGVSPVLLFAGINGSRIIAFLASGALAILLARLFGIEVHGVTLILALGAAAVIYASVGLLVYRCMRSALGVLSAAPIVLLILCLPSFAPLRHWPGAVVYASPVSTMAALSVKPSLWGAVAALGWIACSAVGIGALVIRKK